MLAGIVCLFLAQGLRPHAAPIAIQFCARIGSLDKDGPFPPGVRFLVTNNSPGTLWVRLSSIEVRTSSGWTFHSALTIPAFTLPAHAGTYANIEPAVWPPGPWRINGIAAEELTGAGRAWAAARVLARRTVSRGTLTADPFSKALHYYGGGYEVPSQEVPLQ